MTFTIDSIINTFIDLTGRDIRTPAEKKVDEIYKCIRKCDYAKAITLLSSMDASATIWKRLDAEFSLVIACQDPNTPAQLIELLIDKKIDPCIPLPPDHYDTIDAKIPPVVAAEHGNMVALSVFIARNLYTLEQWKYAAERAYATNQFKITNLILNHQITIIDADDNEKMVKICMTYSNFRHFFPTLSEQ